MSQEKQSFASWKKRGVPNWYIINKNFNTKKLINIREYYNLPLK